MMQTVLRIAFNIWFHCVALVFVFINVFKRKRHVPLVTDRILLLSATKLARSIRRQQLACTGVIEAYIRRIKEINPTLHAVVAENFDGALVTAARIDKMIAAGKAPSETEAPFLGVPFTVKDCVFIQGFPCTAGVYARRNTLCNDDAEIVRNMIAAGAIFLGITNVSECGMWWESNNGLFPRTNNPYDLRRTAGGSSGGEAALIAAAGSVIGVGSDIGGSIRIPANFCGIFGHKPTSGTLSSVGFYPPCTGYHELMHTPGPLCRFAEDLKPMLLVMSENKHFKNELAKPVDFSTLRVYYIESIPAPAMMRVERAVREGLLKVLHMLETKHNIRCKKVNMPLMENAVKIWFNDMGLHDGPPFTQDMVDGHGEVRIGQELLQFLIGKSHHTLPALGLGLLEKVSAYFASEERVRRFISMRETLIAEFGKLLGNDGVLILPSHPTTAPFHSQPLFMPFNFIYTGIFNSLTLPVTQCAIGWNHRGKCLGVQMVTAPFHDRLSIALAEEVEKAFGGWVPPAPL